MSNPRPVINDDSFEKVILDIKNDIKSIDDKIDDILKSATTYYSSSVISIVKNYKNDDDKRRSINNNNNNDKVNEFFGIYKIFNLDKSQIRYKAYTDAVVIAESDVKAILIHPNGKKLVDCTSKDELDEWPRDKNLIGCNYIGRCHNFGIKLGEVLITNKYPLDNKSLDIYNRRYNSSSSNQQNDTSKNYYIYKLKVKGTDLNNYDFTEIMVIGQDRLYAESMDPTKYTCKNKDDVWDYSDHLLWKECGLQRKIVQFIGKVTNYHFKKQGLLEAHKWTMDEDYVDFYANLWD